jgi:hypothetical protein
MKQVLPKKTLADEDGNVVQLRLDRGLPLLDQFSEEGFVDSVFKVEHLRPQRAHFTFHVAASFEGETVGFDCRVLRGIKAGFSAKMELQHVHHEGVEFRRSGEESDRLVRILASRYGRQARGTRMVNSVSFTGIALRQGRLDLEKQPVKIKLFGPDDDQRRYHESFFNLDLRHRLVFWNEKDHEYRAPLIRAVTA